MSDLTEPAFTLPPPSPALEMHQAAAKLRAAAEAARPYERREYEAWGGDWAASMDSALGGPCGVLAGMLSPDAAIAQAEWLDATAVRLTRTALPDWQADIEPHALAVARAVLAAGGAG